jgi:N-acetylglutamate synthase-like GNAT family acetyltransferase
MKIEEAKTFDVNELTELTIRSKSHWNYSKKQIEEWKDDLTITSDYINEKEVYKLIDNKSLIGYYSYFKLNEIDIKMENLFIEPKYIGQGYGKFLMSDFLQRIKEAGFKKVTLDADPNAEKFYSYIGFHIVGQLESSVKDRFLPIMEMEIS